MLGLTTDCRDLLVSVATGWQTVSTHEDLPISWGVQPGHHLPESAAAFHLAEAGRTDSHSDCNSGATVSPAGPNSHGLVGAAENQGLAPEDRSELELPTSPSPVGNPGAQSVQDPNSSYNPSV